MISLEEKWVSDGASNDPFGRNTAILFGALAAYMLVASNAIVGFLLLFVAALMWIHIGGSHAPSKTDKKEAVSAS